MMIGKDLLHYSIHTHLGAGGMGEVYQARDSKLGREVALKILPEIRRIMGISRRCTD
jgi:serine/threonine protein kinase